MCGRFVPQVLSVTRYIVSREGDPKEHLVDLCNEDEEALLVVVPGLRPRTTRKMAATEKCKVVDPKTLPPPPPPGKAPSSPSAGRRGQGGRRT